MSELSKEQKAEARRIFAAEGENNRTCMFCGGFHLRACPRVASFELYEGSPTNPGGVKSVQFWGLGQWEDSNVVWPEDVADDENEDEDEESDERG